MQAMQERTQAMASARRPRRQFPTPDPFMRALFFSAFRWSSNSRIGQSL